MKKLIFIPSFEVQSKRVSFPRLVALVVTVLAGASTTANALLVTEQQAIGFVAAEQSIFSPLLPRDSFEKNLGFTIGPISLPGDDPTIIYEGKLSVDTGTISGKFNGNLSASFDDSPSATGKTPVKLTYSGAQSIFESVFGAKLSNSFKYKLPDGTSISLEETLGPLPTLQSPGNGDYTADFATKTFTPTDTVSMSNIINVNLATF